MLKDDTVTYTFTHVDNNDAGPDFPKSTQNYSTVTFDSCVTWNAVLNQFIRFLEGIYGYNISDQVSYESPDDRFKRVLGEYYEDADGEDQDEKNNEDTPSST